MNEHIDGRSAKEARQIVEADLRRLDRIEAVWSELTDEEQETLAAMAERMHAEDPTRVKIRITQTITVDDDYRRAINLFYGKPGLATREEVVRWIKSFGTSGDDDLMHDLAQAQERGEE